MARPRYQINARDWLDILDWLEFQMSQPHWLTEVDHPIHKFGFATMQGCIAQWRDVYRPSSETCRSAQKILSDALTIEDWSRLRKALSARKRRREEQRIDSKQVNITLTPTAHKALVEFRELSGSKTLSDAIEMGLKAGLADLQKQREQDLAEHLLTLLKPLKAAEFVALVEQYLSYTEQKRSWANSCKVALQLFKEQPTREKLRLVRTRLIEDLTWNEMHLNLDHSSLPIFASFTQE